LTHKIVIIQGHPDSDGQHFCHALAEAYASGARGAGHAVETIDVGRLDFPLLRRVEDFRWGEAPEAIRHSQLALADCQHLVLLYPVWNGGMPALLKGFLEQVFRPAFVFPDAPPEKRLGFFSALRQRKALAGKTARLVVTMQMPAFIYRWYFRPRSEKSTLGLAGVAPIRDALIGGVERASARRRRAWLAELHRLGSRAN
jgi:putative NADPH-quinone reductase